MLVSFATSGIANRLALAYVFENSGINPVLQRNDDVCQSLYRDTCVLLISKNSIKEPFFVLLAHSFKDNLFVPQNAQL